MLATAAAAKVPSVEITKTGAPRKAMMSGKNEVVAESGDEGEHADAQEHAEKFLALVRGGDWRRGQQLLMLRE